VRSASSQPRFQVTCAFGVPHTGLALAQAHTPCIACAHGAQVWAQQPGAGRPTVPAWHCVATLPLPHGRPVYSVDWAKAGGAQLLACGARALWVRRPAATPLTGPRCRLKRGGAGLHVQGTGKTVSVSSARQLRRKGSKAARCR
jgi:hypothetical protein